MMRQNEPSLQQIAGDLLLVPQFTLAADTRHGLRPGFSTAAPPDRASACSLCWSTAAKARHAPVASGVFGANMQVSLTNDGPVTFGWRVEMRGRQMRPNTHRAPRCQMS